MDPDGDPAFHRNEAISAVQDVDQYYGDDDDFDDLYNDVNVGDGFLHASHQAPPPPPPTQQAPPPQQHQHQQQQLPPPPQQPPSQQLHPPAHTLPPPPQVPPPQQQVRIPGVAVPAPGIPPAQNNLPPPPQQPAAPAPPPPQHHQIQQGDGINRPGGNFAGGPIVVGNGGPAGGGDGPGGTTLFVGELHWWTTDADLESELSKYGPVKEGSPPPAEASAASAVTSRCSTNLLTSLKSTAPRYRPLTGHCRPGKVHNESSCSSPADGTPRSPAEESPRSHSSPCRSDSGQQPHPRNMADEIDILDTKIMSMIGKITSSVSNLNEGWYSCPTGIKYLLEQLAVQEDFKTFTNEMLKERIEKLERMVKDYNENKRSLPEKRMLYVFSHIARQHECVPDTPQRTALVSEEREAPSPKRPRSESVDMAMYLSQPEAASKIFLSRFSMEDCTYKAQQLFEGDMLYSALALLRKDIEIRQSFMTLEDSAARGHIEYELKISGQNPTH